MEDSGGFWLVKAIPANLPYLNLLLLNTGQAVICIFLSSEFLKRDKKLDTSEVFYVRPLSNAEYVIGKIWGNLRVFLILNLIIMGIALLFNFMTSGMAVDWMAYILYFLLISIPTLVFIIGLSIFLMLVLKNQALTFIILLGYIGLTIFYISDKFYYLFDYMAYSLPLVKSTIVGFTNWETVLNHRAIYFFAGLAFIFLRSFCSDVCLILHAAIIPGCCFPFVCCRSVELPVINMYIPYCWRAICVRCIPLLIINMCIPLK